MNWIIVVIVEDVDQSTLLMWFWSVHDAAVSEFISAALKVCLNDAAAMVTHQVSPSARCVAAVGLWSCLYRPVIVSNAAYSCMFTHMKGHNICHYRGGHCFLFLYLFLAGTFASVPTYVRTVIWIFSLSLSHTHTWDEPCTAQKQQHSTLNHTHFSPKHILC